MAVIRGALVSYSDPLLGLLPTVVAFQYNPTAVTRVFRHEAAAGEDESGSLLNTRQNAVEEYTFTLELDATDGLAQEAPLTLANGIAPRLAALEMLMQPLGSSDLGSLLGHSSPVVGKLPLVLLLWGPGRVAPVLLTSLTIHETAFDELLNPVHASADVGLRVLRRLDVPDDDHLAQAAASYYQKAREVRAVLQVAQVLELGA
jgi:hypothetical protein